MNNCVNGLGIPAPLVALKRYSIPSSPSVTDVGNVTAHVLPVAVSAEDVNVPPDATFLYSTEALVTPVSASVMVALNVSPEPVVLFVIIGTVVSTMKSVKLFPVNPPTVTVILPVVALVGTVAVIAVAELELTVAAVPLNLTALLPGVASKLVPVIVTDAPIVPLEGVKEVIAGVTVIIKLLVLVTV